MKYVYVLTSTINDLYYEQCLMSVFSLKTHNPDSHVIILVDNKTKDSFTKENKRDGLKNAGAEIVSVNFDDSIKNVERSRRLKTTIPQHISGDFLFIDCDTIICDNLSDIENINSNFAAVLDGHVPLSQHKHKEYFIKREKKLGFTATKTLGVHFNSGVMLYRDCEKSRKMFDEWNKIWDWCFTKKHDHHDQPAFNEANLRSGKILSELSGEWNCQISQGGLQFLKNAKIIHYFSSEAAGKNYISYYKLADKSIQQRIKETGKIPEDIKQMILDPKFQFTGVHLLNDQRLIEIMQSPLIFTISDIKSHCPGLYKIIDGICACFRKFAKKIKGKK